VIFSDAGRLANPFPEAGIRVSWYHLIPNLTGNRNYFTIAAIAIAALRIASSPLFLAAIAEAHINNKPPPDSPWLVFSWRIAVQFGDQRPSGRWRRHSTHQDILVVNLVPIEFAVLAVVLAYDRSIQRNPRKNSSRP